MKKLDKYILKRFLGTFFFALGIFMAIVIVFDISEKIDDFLETNTPLNEIIFDYYLNFIPYFASILSPLLIFIAVIYFTAQLANKTEIVAILSSGVSFRRFLWPYWIGATLLAVVSFAFNGYLIPKANKTRIDFEYKYFTKKKFSGLKNIHLQVDTGKFIFIQTYNQPRSMGYKFAMETFKGDTLKEKLMDLGYVVRLVDGKNPKISFYKEGFKTSIIALKIQGSWLTRPIQKYPKKYFENDLLINFYGIKCLVPNPPDLLLEHVYGPSWKIPYKGGRSEVLIKGVDWGYHSLKFLHYRSLAAYYTASKIILNRIVNYMS